MLKIGDRVKIDPDCLWWKLRQRTLRLHGSKATETGTGAKTRHLEGRPVQIGVAYRVVAILRDEAVLAEVGAVPIMALLFPDQRAAAKTQKREWLEKQPLNVVPLPGFLGGNEEG